MPAKQRHQPKLQPPSHVPSTPAAKPTAKYTNKDGSKFITVPKSADLPPTTMAQTTTKPNGQVPSDPPVTNGEAPAVNRKKQKRREKLAAKLAAEHGTNGAQSSRHTEPLRTGSYENGVEQNGQYDEPNDFETGEGEQDFDSEDGAYSGSYGRNDSPTNGYTANPYPANPYTPNPGKKSKKKKKNKGGQADQTDYTHRHVNGHSHGHLNSHAALNLPPVQPNMPRGEKQI